MARPGKRASARARAGGLWTGLACAESHASQSGQSHLTSPSRRQARSSAASATRRAEAAAAAAAAPAEEQQTTDGERDKPVVEQSPAPPVERGGVQAQRGHTRGQSPGPACHDRERNNG
eukprot:6038724-Pleurochrysis_carterae.AAC.2